MNTNNTVGDWASTLSGTGVDPVAFKLDADGTLLWKKQVKRKERRFEHRPPAAAFNPFDFCVVS